MTSPKKTAANGRNAYKSSGPKSERGKALSRFNALRSRLYAVQEIVPGEDAKIHRKHLRDVFEQYKPQNPIERALVDQIAGAIWRLRRLKEAENAFFIRMLDSRRMRTIRSFTPKELEIWEHLLGTKLHNLASASEDGMLITLRHGTTEDNREIKTPQYTAREISEFWKKLKHLDDLSLTFLEGIVPIEEKNPVACIDRQRRTVTRILLNHIDSLSRLRRLPPASVF